MPKIIQNESWNQVDPKHNLMVCLWPKFEDSERFWIKQFRKNINKLSTRVINILNRHQEDKNQFSTTVYTNKCNSFHMILRWALLLIIIWCQLIYWMKVVIACNVGSFELSNLKSQSLACLWLYYLKGRNFRGN